jgi:hypothetical protein
MEIATTAAKVDGAETRTGVEGEEKRDLVPVTFRLERQLLKRIPDAARRLGLSKTGYISLALAEKLEQMGR